MSVYTPVSHNELAQHLEHYCVGQLISYRGISAGVENSNFFVDTDQGRYVLTLVESVPAEKLPFILGLVDHLASLGLPCAQPIHLNSGELFTTLNNRPAVLMGCLQGSPLETPNNQQVEVIGKTLAQFHQLSSQLDVEAYVHIPQWCTELGARLFNHLDGEQQILLQSSLMEAGEIDWTMLPSGPVHADLFPDNAMFVVSGDPPFRSYGRGTTAGNDAHRCAALLVIPLAGLPLSPVRGTDHTEKSYGQTAPAKAAKYP